MKKIPADGATRRHAYFDEEYKREALRLWRESGRSAAKMAAELGIRPELLYKWARVKRTELARLLVQLNQRSQAKAKR